MINTIIVDDERPSIRFIERLLNDFENINILGSYTDIDSAIHNIKSLDIDLVFLDIEMPNMSGITACKLIKEISPSTYIIFITAYTEHALDAFEVEATDYILKPPTKQRIQKALSRIKISSKPNEYKSKILTFGNFESYFNSLNDDSIKWRTKKTKELFAYFIHNYNKPIDKNKILDDLWNEYSYENSKNLLHNSISNLRKILSVNGFNDCIKYSNQCYTLNLTNTYIDFLEYKKYAFIDNINIHNISQAKQAINIYKGDYLVSEDYIWSIEEKNYLSLSYKKLLLQICEYYEKNNLYNDSLIYVTKLIKYNPLIEEPYAKALCIYSKLGDYKSFNKIYCDLEKALYNELNISPSKELQLLYKKLKN